MQTVAIVGVGLIGASFGLAIQRAGFKGRVLGVSSPSAIDAGLAAGAISYGVSLQDAAAEADLIYLAQPVDRIIQTIAALGPIAQPRTLITDAGSTKTEIVRAASTHLLGAQFLGGHPMAGKESRGAESADADLFRDRLYVLTPEAATIPGGFHEMLLSIGANVLHMSAADHDATVALTSHLPQLISTALASLLQKHDQPQIQQVFGSGLLDMTRLALSPGELWNSIIATNKANVLLALDSYIDSLSELKAAVNSGNLDSAFQRAAEFSTMLRK